MTNFASPVQRAGRFIDIDERLRALQVHVHEIMRLQEIWQTIAPTGLASVSRIGQINADAISIYCDHGAAAAKLRQLVPSIRTALASHGISSTDILVKVRTQAIPDRNRNISKPGLSQTALHQLENLRAQLEEGRLKTALVKLLDRHRQ